MLRTLHTILHTVCFWTWIVLALPIFFGPAFVIWLVTLPFDPNGRVLHLYTCFWCAQHMWVNPLWRMDVQGKEKIDRSKAYVYVRQTSSWCRSASSGEASPCSGSSRS